MHGITWWWDTQLLTSKAQKGNSNNKSSRGDSVTSADRKSHSCWHSSRTLTSSSRSIVKPWKFLLKNGLWGAVKCMWLSIHQAASIALSCPPYLKPAAHSTAVNQDGLQKSSVKCIIDCWWITRRIGAASHQGEAFPSNRKRNVGLAWLMEQRVDNHVKWAGKTWR